MITCPCWCRVVPGWWEELYPQEGTIVYVIERIGLTNFYTAQCNEGFTLEMHESCLKEV